MAATRLPARRVRLVWAAVPVAVVLALLASVLLWDLPADALPGGMPTGLILVLAMLLSFVGVGALIAARRPTNPIGWILLASGLLFLLAAVTSGYGFRADRALPGAVTAGWLGQWLAVPPYVLAGFMFLLFPDGRLPSPRWRWFAWPFGVLGALYTIGFAWEAWARRGHGAGAAEDMVPYVGDSVASSLWPAFALLLVVPVASLVIRYRRGRADERAQLRWLAPAGLAIALGPALVPVEAVPIAVSFVLAGVGGIGLPIAIAIAILRYRLYEIDRVLSRTVSYSLVVTALAGVYAASVVGLGTAASALTGQRDSDLTVAVAVLAVAALFRPVRSRVQAAVDRRFNRSGYDARRAVEAFTDRLRDEVDLEELQSDLAGTAAVALQPAHLSVWLVDDGDRGQVSLGGTHSRSATSHASG